MPTFESKKITVGGIATHYLEQGSGPTLVLVHGGGAGADSWGNWKDCMPAYAAGFRVVAPDMVGFGRSAKPDPASFSYDQTGRNSHLGAFIEVVTDGPVHVIGNSMGGATALGVAMSRPELISKLVLMGSAGLDVNNPDPAVRKALGGYDYTLQGMRALIRTLTAPGYQIDEEMVRYRYELTLAPDSRAALAAIGKAVATQGLAYPEEAIRAVKTPTLVVGGKEDRVAILARTHRFLELLENSWGVIVPHCGHWVMVERPREFVSITTLFLQSDAFAADQ